MADPKPNLTLYFLQASRSIRIAWLMTELGLEYESVFFPRENNKAPADFKEKSGNKLGKAPALLDQSGGEEVRLTESGAIAEYILEKYDKSNKLFGGNDVNMREKIRMWIHAAEGTFLIHALAITYARWFCPPSVGESALKEMEKGLAINVGKDLDWLSSELAENKSKYLVGESLSAADIMVLFSIQFIFTKNLCGGRKISEWRNVESWIKECESTESWKKAVEKTGHELKA